MYLIDVFTFCKILIIPVSYSHRLSPIDCGLLSARNKVTRLVFQKYKSSSDSCFLFLLKLSYVWKL